MKKIAPVLFLIGSAVLVYLYASKPPQFPPTTAISMPEKAAALSGPGLDGKTVSLADHAGKVVLVDFWATWCDPCKAEVPELMRLHDELGPKGFVVLGASMDEDVKSVAAFAAARKVNYPVILLGAESAPGGWNVPGLPTAYLVGRDGAVLKRYLGAKNAGRLKADVDAALAR